MFKVQKFDIVVERWNKKIRKAQSVLIINCYMQNIKTLISYALKK